MGEETAKTGRKSPVHLSLADKAKIVKWLNDHHEWVQGERSGYSEVTRKIGEELGLTFDPKTLTNIASAFGLLWEPKVNTGFHSAARAKLSGRLAEVETRLKELAIHEDVVRLRADVSVLRGLVHHLYQQLGAKPPTGYLLPSESKTVTVANANGK